MYDKDGNYRTRHSSSRRIALARQRAHSSRHRTLDGADSVRLHPNNHRSARGGHPGLDTLFINGPMVVLSLYAGKLSLRRVSPLCTRVTGQY